MLRLALSIVMRHMGCKLENMQFNSTMNDNAKLAACWPRRQLPRMSGFASPHMNDRVKVFVSSQYDKSDEEGRRRDRDTFTSGHCGQRRQRRLSALSRTRCGLQHTIGAQGELQPVTRVAEQQK